MNRNKISWKDQLICVKAKGETYGEADLRNNIFKDIGRTKTIEEVLELLPLCDVCGSSHGKWVDANKLKKQLQKLKEAKE